ncbi:MAG TPA: MFS transporter [Cellulomonas sp.]
MASLHRVGNLPARTVVLMAAICIGYFVDSAIYLLLLLSSSAQDVSWWVTAVVLANLVPPILLAPVLGWIVDRTSGRAAWTASLALSALCAVGIGFLDSPVALVALAAVQSTCSVVVSAAVFKLLPRARAMDERSASSFAVGIGSIASIGAPPLAALVAALGADVAFWVCGALLTGSAVLVLRAGPRVAHVEVEATSWHEAWLGTRTIRTMAVFRAFIPVLLGVVVVTSMEGVAGVFYLQEVAGSAVGYALLLSAWAVGSLVGAGMTSRTRVRLGAVHCVLIGGLAVSAAILVEGLVASAVVIAVAFVGGGVGNAIHNVGVRNLVYEQVPRNQQAQVWSVVGATFAGAAAVGNFLGTPGLLAPAQPVIVIAGALGVVLVLATLGWTLLRPRANRSAPAPQAAAVTGGQASPPGPKGSDPPAAGVVRLERASPCAGARGGRTAAPDDSAGC